MTDSLARILERNTNTRPVYLSAAHAQGLVDRLTRLGPDVLQRPARLDAYLRLQAGPTAPAAESDGPRRTVGQSTAPLWLVERSGGQVQPLGEYLALLEGIAVLRVSDALPARGGWFCDAAMNVSFVHGYDTINHALRHALADASVRGVLVYMDSPGGVVHDGLSQITDTLRAAQKPVWVHADMACSAAYWIAAQAERILAPRTGLVGSIGAVIVHMDAQGWLKGQGVKLTEIQFGAHKTDGAYWKELSEDARAHLQAWVDQAGRDFVAAVVSGRPDALNEAAVLDQGARFYSAEHDDATLSGLALGLVDEIAGEEDAFDALVEYAQV